MYVIFRQKLDIVTKSRVFWSANLMEADIILDDE